MMAGDLPLMIFAAGFGSRMGALTRDRPKPMVDVAGRPLIDHALALANGAGIARIVVNTHYRPEPLERHLADRGVMISREEPEILDTGGGLRQALPLLGAETVYTLNSDIVWTGPNPLAALARHWRPGMGALMMLAEPGRIHGRDGPGDFARAADGRLTRGGDLVYTGAQIIDASAIHAVSERVFSVARLWDEFAANGRLFGIVHPGHWVDAGHPGGIAAAEALRLDV
ncbi:MurNAc alpha-1-phosphate uridylyltransferase [Palleronia aestuarii]|uniref:MurNAc alpha-1-phosphate uridylyltransferase n=1 Tax=Palleronia aestuarii TaxID=568105 RepID=A0A2W7QB66_9RHOB|nr:nucleotidyltransferase family protein [Palleronia aestuarii]PZX18989.1 MurNAc alpha-1-phosphate uridylyltransferase [Palleronia aestuarii]